MKISIKKYIQNGSEHVKNQELDVWT